MKRTIATLALPLMLYFGLSDSSFADSTPRLTVFISDLHFGLGRMPNGAWNPREDFRWTAALGSFLDEISKEGGDKVDLVIAGDMMELWQPPATMDCGKDANLGCTISQMEDLTRIVVKMHKDDFNLLGRFANRGDNRLYIIPGNHDAALVIDSVWHIVEPAFGANAGRLKFQRAGIWGSADGRIVAEHGHQIWPDVNSYKTWPVVTREGRMIRPWGEYFVQNLYNKVEDDFPAIDNLVPNSAGIKYRVQKEGISMTAADIGQFAQFVLVETSSSQKISFLGPEEPKPEEDIPWNIEAGRSLGARLILDGLDKDDPARVEGNEKKKELERLVMDHEAMPDELVQILCDRLALQHAADNHVPLCVKPHLSYAMHQIGIISLDRILRKHLSERLKTHPGMTLFVYGHTHTMQVPWNLTVKKGTTVRVVNTGTFQRLIDDDQFRQAAKGKPAELLSSLSLEELAPCYSAVLVTYVNGYPHADLKNWRELPGGKGMFVSPCDPACAKIEHSCK